MCRQPGRLPSRSRRACPGARRVSSRAAPPGGLSVPASRPSSARARSLRPPPASSPSQSASCQGVVPSARERRARRRSASSLRRDVGSALPRASSAPFGMSASSSRQWRGRAFRGAWPKANDGRRSMSHRPPPRRASPWTSPDPRPRAARPARRRRRLARARCRAGVAPRCRAHRAQPLARRAAARRPAVRRDPDPARAVARPRGPWAREHPSVRDTWDDQRLPPQTVEEM